MKPSHYNFFFPYEADETKVIAYNAYSNALALMDKSKHEMVERFASAGVVIKDEEFVTQLKAGNFLIEDDCNELDRLRLRMLTGRFNTDALALTITPTADCNFRCLYCYEKDVIKPTYMNKETEDAIVKMVENYMRNLSSLHITWYGGEVLMHMDTVERLSGAFIALCNENNVNYTASMVTNGYLLTREIIEKIHTLKISSMQITIDGDKETHDHRRPHADGTGTFDIIINNLTEHKDILPLVSLRINIDKNNTTAGQEIMNFLTDKGLTEKIKPYLGYTQADNDTYDKNSCFDSCGFSGEDFQFYSQHADENNYMEINEIDLMRIGERISRYNPKTLTLTIAPTMDCNMACPYCFEKNCENYMNEETQDRLYEFAVSYLKEHNCKNLNIIWYGGEPLMASDVIFNLAPRLIVYCEKNNIFYSSFIVTNGYLLNKELAKRLLDECKIDRAQITVDGIPEQHNKRRILKNGEESYETIINNISECKDIINIHIRVNVDKSNLHSLNDFWEQLKEYNWITNPMAMPAPVTYHHEQSSFAKEICITPDELSNLHKYRLEQLYDLGAEIPTNTLLPTRRNVFCSAVNLGTYVVDPDGNLYTCWDCVGIEEKRIGNIFSDSSEPEYLKWLLHDVPIECEQCNLMPICMGGCPQMFFKENKVVCDNIKYTLKNNLNLLYKIYCDKKQLNTDKNDG